MKGTVKWFSQEKGYGFITAEGNQDYFFGVRDVIGAVLPATGSQVTFTPSTGPKGPKAIEITILSRPPNYSPLNHLQRRTGEVLMPFLWRHCKRFYRHINTG